MFCSHVLWLLQVCKGSFLSLVQPEHVAEELPHRGAGSSNSPFPLIRTSVRPVLKAPSASCQLRILRQVNLIQCLLLYNKPPQRLAALQAQPPVVAHERMAWLGSEFF